MNDFIYVFQSGFLALLFTLLFGVWQEIKKENRCGNNGGVPLDEM